PFTFKAGKRAVLLLHGFTGHSADVRMLGRFLEKHNYTSHAPIYKGHGKSPEELLQTTPSDWWEDVVHAYEFLSDEGYEEIAVVGLSMGGALGLKLTYTTKVMGVVPMCTPIFFDNIARRLEGKRLLREAIPISDSHFQQLITNHYITSVPAVQKHFLRFSCTRCQNKDRHLFALMPCGRCNQTHVYCRHCIEMGRCMSCEQLYYWTGPKYEWEQHDSPCTWLGKLN